jgi:hypothetical protein
VLVCSITIRRGDPVAWPRWRHTLNEAKRLAVKAVDEYNCSTGNYGDFIGTMVRAWLYLLQAEFQRDEIDCRYKSQDVCMPIISSVQLRQRDRTC